MSTCMIGFRLRFSGEGGGVIATEKYLSCGGIVLVFANCSDDLNRYSKIHSLKNAGLYPFSVAHLTAVITFCR
jgi:hypothetical protein